MAHLAALYFGISALILGSYAVMATIIGLIDYKVSDSLGIGFVACICILIAARLGVPIWTWLLMVAAALFALVLGVSARSGSRHRGRTHGRAGLSTSSFAQRTTVSPGAHVSEDAEGSPKNELTFYDRDSRSVGSVGNSGTIYDRSGRRVGTHSDIGPGRPRSHAGAGALLLLL